MVDSPIAAQSGDNGDETEEEREISPSKEAKMENNSDAIE